MTISTEVSRISHLGAGTTGPFAVPFFFAADSDLLIIKTTIADDGEQVLALGADYTCVGAGVAAGGSVTTTVAVGATHRLNIVRNPPQKQNSVYAEVTKFPAKATERAFDDTETRIQRAIDLSVRSLRLTDGDSSGDSTVLPGPISRVNGFLGFDANGNITILGALTGVTVPTTAGRIIFGAGGVALNSDAALVWDNVNKRQGIGIGVPVQALDVVGSIKASVSVLTPVVDGGANTPVTFPSHNASNINIVADTGAAFNGGAGIDLVGRSNGAGTRRTWRVITDTIATADFVVSQSTAEGGATFQPMLRLTGGGSPNYFQMNAGGNATLTSNGGGIAIASANNNLFLTTGTTASAANAFLDSGNFGNLLRSTSSERYKVVLRDLELDKAQRLLFDSRKVVYESKSDADYAGEEHIGFLAEDIAAIDPRMITLDGNGRPDWVQYPHFVVPLALVASDHERRIKKLEALVNP